MRSGRGSDVTANLLAETSRVGKPVARSTITHGFQIVVRLDDLTQAVLVRSVAAVGVGVMALHQDLELGLDVGRAGVGFKSEGIEGLALGVAHRPAFRGGPLALGPPRPRAQVAEHPERIGRAALAEPARVAVRLAAVHPHLPGGAMAGDGLLLILGDRVVAHAGEEIVRLVVFAHVLEAEPPIFALAQPALGGAVRRAFAAARPVAARTAGPHAAVGAGLDPDTVEKGRTDLHGRRLCGPETAGRKLDK